MTKDLLRGWEAEYSAYEVNQPHLVNASTAVYMQLLKTADTIHPTEIDKLADLSCEATLMRATLWHAIDQSTSLQACKEQAAFSLEQDFRDVHEWLSEYIEAEQSGAA